VASAAPLSLGGGKLCLRGKRLFTELASVGSRQGGQGARGYMGERAPGRLVPRPTGCGYPHVRLVMHVHNCARHATARPNTAASRQAVRSTNCSNSIPIPPTSVYSAQSMFLGRPISGVPKPLRDDVCWAYGLPLAAPRIGGGSRVRNSAPCSWQGFSRALSHSGLMPGARADPWVGPRL